MDTDARLLAGLRQRAARRVASSRRGVTAGEGPHVLAVCSSGGHLAQMVSMRDAFGERVVRWVTFPTADALSLLAGEQVIHAHHPTTRNIPNLLRNSWLAVRLVWRTRPSLIVSNGAGVALPFFVVGWVLRIPTVYVEVFDRIDNPTLTGRLCQPFTTKMLVQWDEQLSLYRNAVLVGPLL